MKAAIICAGGIGERMGAGKPKQFIELSDGTSILRRSVDMFRKGAAGCAFDVIVVTSPADFTGKTEEIVNSGCADDEKACVIEGGSERQDSVWNALEFLADKGFADDDVVLIHDGARPFVTSEIILGVLDAASREKAAIAAVPVKDTIRDVRRGTLERNGLYQVQTPQGFRFGIIMNAVRNAVNDGFYGTDDGGLVEREGVMPAIVPGSYDNIKITTPDDIRKSR